MCVFELLICTGYFVISFFFAITYITIYHAHHSDASLQRMETAADATADADGGKPKRGKKGRVKQRRDNTANMSSFRYFATR